MKRNAIKIQPGSRTMPKTAGLYGINRFNDPMWQAKKEIQPIISIQDEAVVVSVDFALQGKKEHTINLLQIQMEDLAFHVQENGGIVGHIKTSVEARETAVISVTLDKADIRKGSYEEIFGKFTAIILLMKPERIQELVEDMFKRITADQENQQI